MKNVYWTIGVVILSLIICIIAAGDFRCQPVELQGQGGYAGTE